MPPSWTDTTDPNVDFDTQGRVYQTMLPFNAFWDASRLHPDGEIDLSYSDDMGRHWVKGNHGVPLEPPNNASALQLGHVEDKQWVAVNHIAGNSFQDHVYAAWAVFNGQATKVRIAVSRDRGVTFDKAVTISPPSQVGPGVTYVYPEIDAAGVLYVSVVSFPPNGGSNTIYVARSTDDGRTFSAFVPVTTATVPPGEVYSNTRFRSGIVENFAASPTYAGHLYLTYEDWDAAASQADVKFTQSTDGGQHWSTPVVVNDNVDAPVCQPTSSSPRSLRDRRAQWRSSSMTAARRVRTIRAFSPPTSAGRTSALTRRSRRTRTPVLERCRSARTSASLSSPGIRSSRDSTLAGCPSTHVPGQPIHAPPATASSATTSGWRSRPATSTASSYRRTTRQT